MKKFLFGGVFTLVALFAAGCSLTNSQPQADQLQVAASIFPLYDITRTVAGEDAHVVLMTPVGTSPHVFEPTPSLVRDLQGSTVLFHIGAGLDEWVQGLSRAVDGAQIIELSEFVLTEEEADHDDHDEHADEDHNDHDEDGHHHGEGDPHYWLSPDHAKTMALVIAEQLGTQDPNHAEAYLARAQAFIQELEVKDAEWQTQLASLNNKQLVTFHDAFGHFAEHFGLEVLTTFEPFAGKEPTLQYIANLQSQLQQYQIKTLYLEPQLSKEAIAQFAEDNNIQLGVLDPLGGAEGTNSYIELIEYNVNTIAQTN